MSQLKGSEQLVVFLLFLSHCVESGLGGLDSVEVIIVLVIRVMTFILIIQSANIP